MTRTQLPSMAALLLLTSCFSGRTPGQKGLFGQDPGADAHPQAPFAAKNGCWPAAPAPAEGEAPLAPSTHKALLIGATQSPGGPALPGAAADVEAVYGMLRTTYGLSESDVCVLLDGDATTAAVTEKLGALAGAKGEAGQAAFVFFAGAGRQVLDDNYDESDAWDEAWALADGDLLDDTYAPLVEQVAAAWPHVLMAVDASHQAAEAEVAGRTVRFAGRVGEEPVEAAAPSALTEEAVAAVSDDEPALAPDEVTRDEGWPEDLGLGDGGQTWHVSGVENLTTLSASRLKAAIEIDGRGVFTQALVAALGSPGLTYDQLRLQMVPLSAASSDQVLGYDGGLSRVALGAEASDRPLSWMVTGSDKATGAVTFEGVQMPGWGQGALLRLYPATATKAVAADPAQAIGTVKVDSLRGFSATGSLIVGDGEAAPRLTGGELAVLARPGADVARIDVRLREGAQPTDLTAEQAQAIRDAIAADAVLAATLNLVTEGGFAIGRDPARPGNLQVLGPEGTVRNSMKPAQKDGEDSVIDKVLHNLRLHAKQKALFHIQGDPGTQLVNDETLQVKMVANEAQDECAKGVWIPAEAGAEQLVPMCHRWQIEVALADGAPYPLEVGGTILFNDGNIVGFPTDGSVVTLEPGKSHTFPLKLGNREAGLKSIPPLDITEYVLVYGTQVGNSVKYNELTATAKRGTADGVAGALDAATSTDRDVSSGSELDVGAWTRSTLPFRVVANTKMRPEAAAVEAATAARELTLNDFDVAPYLPADDNSYLYKILQNAKILADFEQQPGQDIPYAQCWPDGTKETRSRKPTSQWPRGQCWDKAWEFEYDEQELREGPGIDCSTTVWWLYTRACKGDTSLAMPKRKRREKSSAYKWRVMQWHSDADQRSCLLMNYGMYRAGYATTSMLIDDNLMKDEWNSCMGEKFEPGDMLVTRNRSNTSGHVYIVVDPDNYVVFGSHGGDYSWDSSMKGLTDEEKAFLAKYEELDKGNRDAGAEFQYLTWTKKSDLEDRWQGFAHERLKSCWRHKKVADEWKTNPASRPGSADLSAACRPGQCTD